MASKHNRARFGERTGRVMTFLALLVLELAGCDRNATVSAANSPPRSEGTSAATIGGSFTLLDQQGRRVDQRLLLGRWSAVFFGYTYCPDTCPATLQALAAAQAQLGAAAQKTFQIVFISVDSARDHPAQMKLYMSSQGLPQGALGLTGTAAEISRVARAYHAFYMRQGQGSDSLIEHSAAIYLMGPDGGFVRPLDETQTPAALAGHIRDAMLG